MAPRRLPTELILAILSFLPAHDLLRLRRDFGDDLYIDRLLWEHSIFDQRQVVICLTVYPILPASFQARISPGRVLPEMTVIENATCRASEFSVYYSTAQRLRLTDIHTHHLQFEPTTMQWLRCSEQQQLAIAVVLINKNNIVRKRCLHMIQPHRMLSLQQQGYFGGTVTFERHSVPQQSFVRLSQCTVLADWFCL